MIIEITDEQLSKIKEELDKVNYRGMRGKEEDASTWEYVGKWHGIKFVLDEFGIKI